MAISRTPIQMFIEGKVTNGLGCYDTEEADREKSANDLATESIGLTNSQDRIRLTLGCMIDLTRRYDSFLEAYKRGEFEHVGVSSQTQ